MLPCHESSQVSAISGQCSLVWCSGWEFDDTHRQSGLWTGECVFPNSARAGSQVSGSKYVTRCLWSGRGAEACGRRRRDSLLVRRPEASSRRLCGRLGLWKELWLSFWENGWGENAVQVLDQEFEDLSIYTTSAASLLVWSWPSHFSLSLSLGPILPIKIGHWIEWTLSWQVPSFWGSRT